MAASKGKGVADGRGRGAAADSRGRGGVADGCGRGGVADGRGRGGVAEAIFKGNAHFRSRIYYCLEMGASS